ncbi:MAG: hypothetical protein ACXWIP_02530, partial [Burkholderiales bacterium]
EDMTVARQMADMYEGDLQRATEIVLDRRRRVRTAETVNPRPHRAKASAARAAAGALRLSNTVGAAITNRRVLGRNEASIMAGTGAVLLVLTAIGIAWPVVLAAPIVLVAGWVGIALLVRALGLYIRPRREEPRAPGSSRGWNQRP